MAQVLERLDPAAAAGILSLAARSLLPQPEDDRKQVAGGDQAAANALINELTRDRTDVRAVQEALSREISSYFLKGADPHTIRDRVGAKGALSPSLYDVIFSENFEQGVNTWGLTRSHISNAIHHCDQVQHFSTTLGPENEAPFRSLFTQVPTVRRDYTIMVNCVRAGSTLVVDSAYRIYHNEIDLTGATTPLDVLKRFLFIFGDEIEIKIIDANGIDVGPSRKGKLFHEIIFDIPEGGEVIQNIKDELTIRHSAPGTKRCEFTLTYSVNVERYIEQLKRHGVAASLPEGPLVSQVLRRTSRGMRGQAN